LAAACLLLALLLQAGCVTLGSFPLNKGTPPTGPACHVVATWHNQVVYTPDPTHGGNPTPGLAGRLYLLGPDIAFPVAGDGSLVVDLYNDAPAAAGAAPVLLEEWRIDKDTLRRLLQRDTVGWGYTLFLPWGSYKPEITHVHVQLRYQPLNGAPLYSNSSTMTLASGAHAPGWAAGPVPSSTPAAAQGVAPPALAAQPPPPPVPVSAVPAQPATVR
jgi:hypothetical protein